VATRGLTDTERHFLLHPPSDALARLATVDVDRLPHAVPVGWSFDTAGDQIVLGGRNVLGTKHARHIEATGVAAASIDGISRADRWSPWAVIVRGRAALDQAKEATRLSCDQVTSRGIHQN